MRSTLTDIAAWKVFAAVVKTGSFTRAAIELDLTVSKVSRILSQLEIDLGQELIDRTVRPLQPTQLGESFLPKLKSILLLWDEFESSFGSNKVLAHVVKLSTPVGIGRFYLNQQLSEYHEIAPHVVIEASIEKGVEALISRETDVVFLPYVPERSGLRIYPAMRAFTMPLASPEYIATKGNPQTPEELRRHTLILKSGENFPQASHLVFKGKRRPVCWNHVIFHHDMLNIKDAVLRGFGIGLDIPLGMVLDELRQRRLVPVLNGWHRDFWQYSIVTREQDGPQTAVGQFAAWYAKRATREINERRQEGFRILGINPDLI